MKTARLSFFDKVVLFVVLMLRESHCKVKVRDDTGGDGADASISCACTGSNQGFNTFGLERFDDRELFPAEYGTSCKAWDKVNCTKAWPGETYGPWCCASWCYVSNATCDDAVASIESPGLYYAYFGPCGVDTEQVNATNCPLHHNWDESVSLRARGFLKNVLTYAVGDVEVCPEEEEEDTTALKSLSYVLGIAIVGSGLGVLLFVWIIRCDPRWFYECLCVGKSTPEKQNVEATKVAPI